MKNYAPPAPTEEEMRLWTEHAPAVKYLLERSQYGILKRQDERCSACDALIEVAPHEATCFLSPALKALRLKAM